MILGKALNKNDIVRKIFKLYHERNPRVSREEILEQLANDLFHLVSNDLFINVADENIVRFMKHGLPGYYLLAFFGAAVAGIMGR